MSYVTLLRTFSIMFLWVSLLAVSQAGWAADPEPAKSGDTPAAVAADTVAPTPDKPAPALPRPPSWAQPADSKSIANFFKVGDELYRGAEPMGSGYAELKKMGVRTVINLRAFHSDSALCDAATLLGVQIRMRQLTPEPEEVAEFLRIVTNPQFAPYFVHCDKGSERTGVMCAIYRIALCDWTKEDAIREMTGGGFGTNVSWGNQVIYIKGLNVDALRKQAAAAKAEANGKEQPATAAPAAAPATPAAPPAP